MKVPALVDFQYSGAAWIAEPLRSGACGIEVEDRSTGVVVVSLEVLLMTVTEDDDVRVFWSAIRVTFPRGGERVGHVKTHTVEYRREGEGKVGKRSVLIDVSANCQGGCDVRQVVED